MAMRTIAAKLAFVLAAHAASDRYPTRSVEYLLSWAMLSWSLMVIIVKSTVVDGHFVALPFFFPYLFWGMAGVGVACFRLFALIRNGGWRKSAWLRLLGASVGIQFWMSLIVLNSLSFLEGVAAADPMFCLFPVFVFFEAYSCFRCGQDARRVAHLSM